MNLKFQTDDSTRYTLTKSENFGYTLSVSRKRTQEEIDNLAKKGLSKGKEVKEWTTPFSTFHATLDQVAEKVVWYDTEGDSIQDLMISQLEAVRAIKETIKNVTN